MQYRLNVLPVQKYRNYFNYLDEIMNPYNKLAAWKLAVD